MWACTELEWPAFWAPVKAWHSCWSLLVIEFYGIIQLGARNHLTSTWINSCNNPEELKAPLVNIWAESLSFKQPSGANSSHSQWMQHKIRLTLLSILSMTGLCGYFSPYCIYVAILTVGDCHVNSALNTSVIQIEGNKYSSKATYIGASCISLLQLSKLKSFLHESFQTFASESDWK